MALFNEVKSAPDAMVDNICDATGGDKWHVPWPLPNLKPSSEREFWGWRSSYSFKGEVWLGQKKIDDGWANVILYWLDQSHHLNGGFAVAYFHQYMKEHVKYYSWGKCEHDFAVSKHRNCYEEFTCKKCGGKFDVYSD